MTISRFQGMLPASHKNWILFQHFFFFCEDIFQFYYLLGIDGYVNPFPHTIPGITDRE